MPDLAKKVILWQLSQNNKFIKVGENEKFLISNHLSILIKHIWMEGAARETTYDLSYKNSDLQTASN